MHIRLSASVLLTLVLALAGAIFSTSAQAQCNTDADMDGYIDVACGGTDCDDSDPNINPGMLEIPGNGIDENCDGLELCYPDADLDGFSSVNPSLTASLNCPGPLWYSTSGLDCDDGAAAVYPGAIDIPGNGIDEDCDGADSLPVPVPDSSWGTLKGRY